MKQLILLPALGAASLGVAAIGYAAVGILLAVLLIGIVAAPFLFIFKKGGTQRLQRMQQDVKPVR